MPLMRTLASEGFHSVACNQRGYSPKARPALEEQYNYNILASDVWALAAAANFSERFHLVGHDHGAVLGWTVAASAQGRARLLSYSALSIPHPVAFANGLFGADADIQQQVASQYFTMFTMNNSASHAFGLFYHAMAGGPDSEDGFNSEEDFQKALWWYNGAFAAGVMAMPPLFSGSELLLKYKNPAMAALREAFDGCDECKAHPGGIPASHPTATVHVPSLFVCGKSDSSILCGHDYAMKTRDYVNASYTYLQVDCGHEVLTVGSDCTEAEVDKVTQGILAVIKLNRTS